MKYLQPVLIALIVAIISAAGSMMYRHETMIGDQANAIKVMGNSSYRNIMLNHQYHESIVSSQIRIMDLKADTDNGLTIAEKSWVKYLESLHEKIKKDMERAIEEKVNNGN